MDVWRWTFQKFKKGWRLTGELVRLCFVTACSWVAVMRSFFLGLYKVLYRYPCKYPLGFPIIVWLFLGGLSLFDWAVVVPLFSVPVFFFVTVLVDVCFWGFVLPRDSFVFPELGVRNRVYLCWFTH